MKGSYKVVSFAFILAFTLIFLSIASTVHAATDIASVNWSGYTFYRSDNAEFSEVASYITIPTVKLPESRPEGSEDEHYFAIDTWVGVSPEPDGSPILLQGGWGIEYERSTSSFVEYFVLHVMVGEWTYTIWVYLCGFTAWLRDLCDY